jgi:quercetin dioxygenase-like cupin family protein
MIVGSSGDVLSQVVESPDAKNAAMKALIGPEQGWGDYVMRVIELGAGGHSPAHTHPWPHINYVLEGEGVLQLESEEHRLEAGHYALVPAGTFHQYRNAGEGMFRFICIVPTEGHVV